MHPKVQDLIASLPALNPFLEPWNTAQSIGVARPRVSLSSPHFYGDSQWKKKVRSCLGKYFGKNRIREIPKAITGSIASSDTLMKSTQVVKEWLKVARQIKGIEIELAGVYQAAWSSQKPVLAIRGISDVVGFKRSPEWTKYACNSAAAFAVALLKSRPITPRLVQSESSNASPVIGEVLSAHTEPVGVFKTTPPAVVPIKKNERLISNLLAISYLPPKLYTITTTCVDRKQAWIALRNETDYPPEDWVYSSKTFYSFHNFDDPIWKNITETGTLEEHNTSYWSEAVDHNRQGLFVELLKGCLKALGRTHDLYYIHRPKIKKRRKKFEYLYFAPTSEYSGSPSLETVDLIKPFELVIKLKEAETPFARYLFESLSNSTRQLITQFGYQDQVARDLTSALVQDLNELLRSPFFRDEYCQDVYLRREVNNSLTLALKDLQN